MSDWKPESSRRARPVICSTVTCDQALLFLLVHEGLDKLLSSRSRTRRKRRAWSQVTVLLMLLTCCSGAAGASCSLRPARACSGRTCASRCPARPARWRSCWRSCRRGPACPGPCPWPRPARACTWRRAPRSAAARESWTPSRGPWWTSSLCRRLCRSAGSKPGLCAPRPRRRARQACSWTARNSGSLSTCPSYIHNTGKINSVSEVNMAAADIQITTLSLNTASYEFVSSLISQDVNSKVSNHRLLGADILALQTSVPINCYRSGVMYILRWQWLNQAKGSKTAPCRFSSAPCHFPRALWFLRAFISVILSFKLQKASN